MVIEAKERVAAIKPPFDLFRLVAVVNLRPRVPKAALGPRW